ncbi:unnamed protein product [Tenebrio molitor]|nr:unnamed protein product [Tenebrio molitor]
MNLRKSCQGIVNSFENENLQITSFWIRKKQMDVEGQSELVKNSQKAVI